MTYGVCGLQGGRVLHESVCHMLGVRDASIRRAGLQTLTPVLPFEWVSDETLKSHNTSFVKFLM